MSEVVQLEGLDVIPSLEEVTVLVKLSPLELLPEGEHGVRIRKKQSRVSSTDKRRLNALLSLRDREFLRLWQGQSEVCRKEPGDPDPILQEVHDPVTRGEDGCASDGDDRLRLCARADSECVNPRQVGQLPALEAVPDQCLGFEMESHLRAFRSQVLPTQSKQQVLPQELGAEGQLFRNGSFPQNLDVRVPAHQYLGLGRGPGYHAEGGQETERGHDLHLHRSSPMRVGPSIRYSGSGRPGRKASVLRTSQRMPCALQASATAFSLMARSRSGSM